MARKQVYDNTSISMLKDEQRVRKRPAVIFGSDDLEGCKHAVFEILSNAIDEAREGFGDLIIVTRYEDLSVDVEDFGRGCPVDWNEKEKRYNWELVFCEMYAGGKYDASGSNYEFSLGLNGLGTCATQYASEYFDAVVRRDGYKYSLHFEKGKNIGGLKKEPADRKKTGSYFHWRPDREVFTEIDIPAAYFQDVIRRQAVVNRGVTFRFRNQVAGKFEVTEYCYENGIVQYLQELTQDNAFTMPAYFEAERRGRDSENRPEMKLKITAAFCFSKGLSHLEYYHNSSWLEHGGSPDKAVRSAFVSAIDQYLKQNGKYQKNESKVTFADVADSLMFESSTFSTQTSYENQTKKAINNKFIQEAMTEFLRERLHVYFIENKTEADKITEQVLVNKRSRESAEKARVNIKKKLTGSIDVTNRVAKFVDCRSKDVERREVYIVQAIIPVRGKTLNCLKWDYDKIFKNEIITDLLKVLGCGVEIQSKHNKEFNSFDLNLLRWNKVIICTDADVDGFQIRTLILTMIYRLVPTLIEAGKVFIAETPLFEITHKSGTYFAYSDAELSEVLAKLPDTKYKIQRSKGLGENDADMMWLTTMNPETRRLIRVEAEDADLTEKVFDLFLGNDLAGRKDFIAEFGDRYIDMTDIS